MLLPDLPGAKAMALGKSSPASDAGPPSPSYTLSGEKVIRSEAQWKKEREGAQEGIERN